MAETPVAQKLEMIPVVTCADFDEDCKDVKCKVMCWLYDPARGMCPYLRAELGDSHEIDTQPRT